LDKTLSAYNPGGKTGGVGYTLFVPDNKAVDDFIKGSNGEFANLDAILNNKPFSEALSRYHILIKKWPPTNFLSEHLISPPCQMIT